MESIESPYPMRYCKCGFGHECPNLDPRTMGYRGAEQAKVNGGYERRAEGLEERLARFLAKVVFTEEGCWLWTGRLNRKGYGEFAADARGIAAHRWLYKLCVGPIPDELGLDHQCHNRDERCPGGIACVHKRCVNPEHVEPATAQENIARAKIQRAPRLAARKVTKASGSITSPEEAKVAVRVKVERKVAEGGSGVVRPGDICPHGREYRFCTMGVCRAAVLPGE